MILASYAVLLDCIRCEVDRVCSMAGTSVVGLELRGRASV
jgi:hypothetical protein